MLNLMALIEQSRWYAPTIRDIIRRGEPMCSPCEMK